MKPHQNLFDYYQSKSEVYEKLQSDYLRDNKQIKFGAVILNILVIVGLFLPSEKWQIVLFVAAAFAAVQLIILFVDQSNRNFLMHAKDWFEASKEAK